MRFLGGKWQKKNADSCGMTEKEERQWQRKCNRRSLRDDNKGTGKSKGKCNRSF
jgi:hypothetical protein